MLEMICPFSEHVQGPTCTPAIYLDIHFLLSPFIPSYFHFEIHVII